LARSAPPELENKEAKLSVGIRAAYDCAQIAQHGLFSTETSAHLIGLFLSRRCAREGIGLACPEIVQSSRFAGLITVLERRAATLELTEQALVAPLVARAAKR
jgi:hypothetical protein